MMNGNQGLMILTAIFCLWPLLVHFSITTFIPWLWRKAIELLQHAPENPNE